MPLPKGRPPDQDLQPVSTTETETASLRDYLRPLRSRWWLIALIAVIAAAGTYQHYRGKPKSYQSSTSVFLAPSSPLDSILGGGGTSGQPDRAANNEAILLKTTPVAKSAARELGYKGDPRSLLGLITVSPAADSDFLSITARGNSPQSAIAVANAFAKAYVRTRRQSASEDASRALGAAESRLRDLPRGADTAQERASLQDQIQRLKLFESVPSAGAEQIEPAATAATISSSPSRAAIFALALGALLGVMLVYAFEFFDRRVKRFEEVGTLYGRSVLVGIPRAPRSAQTADVSRGLQPPFTESFRALRTSLQLKATGSAGVNGRPLRVILVTSAVPQEGKSTVVRNLALAYHEAGLRVAVVDADLRRPQVARGFGVESTQGPGLTEVLAGEVDVHDALQRVEADTEGRETMMRVRERAQREDQSPRGAYRADNGRHDSNGGADRGALSVLTSGRTPADPAAVLTAGGLSAVLHELSQENDIVLVDSAPLLVVSDAVPILSAVDGVLLVSRLNLSTSTNAAQLNDLLSRVPNVAILGMVANDVREMSGAYGYVESSSGRGRRRQPVG